MFKKKCMDCGRELEVDDDIVVYICKCGACAYEKENKEKTK